MDSEEPAQEGSDGGGSEGHGEGHGKRRGRVKKVPTVGFESEVEADEQSEESEEEAQQTSLLVESLTSKWKGHTEKMVVQLIQSKAHVNGRLMEPWEPAFSDYGQTLGATALHFAARRGLLEVCKALVEHRAELDARSGRGVTPMMVAVMFAQVEALVVLIEARASALNRDDSGFTAVDLAMLEGRNDIVRMLAEHEAFEEKQREEEAAHEDANSEGANQWISRRMGLGARPSMTQADLAKLQRSLTTSLQTMGSAPEERP